MLWWWLERNRWNSKKNDIEFIFKVKVVFELEHLSFIHVPFNFIHLFKRIIYYFIKLLLWSLQIDDRTSEVGRDRTRSTAGTRTRFLSGTGHRLDGWQHLLDGWRTRSYQRGAAGQRYQTADAVECPTSTFHSRRSQTWAHVLESMGVGGASVSAGSRLSSHHSACLDGWNTCWGLFFLFFVICILVVVLFSFKILKHSFEILKCSSVFGLFFFSLWIVKRWHEELLEICWVCVCLWLVKFMIDVLIGGCR